jgi:nitric oxide reductase NorD protein
LARHQGLLKQIRGEFEQVVPDLYRKEKRVPDGADHDLDAGIEAITELRAGISPSEKIFWRHHKIDRDLAVAFLLDMSGSTGEAIGRSTDETIVCRCGLSAGPAPSKNYRYRERSHRSHDGRPGSIR